MILLVSLIRGGEILDLRRSWATYYLVEQQVGVRTMMSIGGWSDYSAIEPYLAEPTETRIGEAMRV